MSAKDVGLTMQGCELRGKCLIVARTSLAAVPPTQPMLMADYSYDLKAVTLAEL